MANSLVRFRPPLAVLLACCLAMSGAPVRPAAAEEVPPVVPTPAVMVAQTPHPQDIPVSGSLPVESLAAIDAALAAAGTDRLLVSPDDEAAERIIGIPRDAVLTARSASDGALRVVYRDGAVLRHAAYREPDRLRTLPESRTDGPGRPGVAASVQAVASDSAVNVQAAASEIAANVQAAVFDHAAPARTALEDGNRIGLDVLRARTEKVSGTVIVAVLDTGADLSHPWLAGRTVDPWDVVEGDTTPQDTMAHGTHVAGIIAANTPDNVRIMPIRVFPDDEGAPDSLVVAGIHRAVTHGARIINLSLGGAGTTVYLRKAVQYAISQGVTLIVSAGNGGHDLTGEYPASFGEVVTVGATGRDGDLLYYSNTGDTIDVCAPGEKIISALPDGRTGAESGTSMAAPLVAAAAAMLVLESPGRTPAQVADRLRQNTVDLGAAGQDAVFGAGEINFRQYGPEQAFAVVGAERAGRTPDPAQYLPTAQPAETAASRAAGQLATVDAAVAQGAAGAVPEFKYEMGLHLHAGPSVATFTATVDGLARPMPAPVPGEAVPCTIGLRDLAAGTHVARIEARQADGSVAGAWEQVFAIPEYNVRIRSVGLDGTFVQQPGLQVAGFSRQDARIAGVPVSSAVREGVWLANIDFGALAPTYGVLRVANTAGGSRMEPIYLRTVGNGGDKVLEPSESDAFEIRSGDAPEPVNAWASLAAPSVSADLADPAALWGGGVGIASTRTWMRQVDLTAQGPSLGGGRSGYLLIDTAPFWLELTQSGNAAGSGQPAGVSDAGVDRWWHVGRTAEMEPVLVLGADSVAVLRLPDAPAGETAYRLECVPEGKTLSGILPAGGLTLSLPAGTYAGSLERYRAASGGVQAVDRLTGYLDVTAGTTTAQTFSPGLTDRIRPSDDGAGIVHRWVTPGGFDYRLFVVAAGARAGGTAGVVLPDMVLTEMPSGRTLTRRGTALTAPDRNEQVYALAGVPDGIWRISFRCDATAMRLPVTPAFLTVTVRAGRLVNTGNTPPRKLSDYYTYLTPGGDVAYDLISEFTDAEQAVLDFEATAGYVVDGLFLYRDMSGTGRDIAITARDLAGGFAVLEQEIRITDEEPVEPSYQPIAEIDSLGASPWAMSTVQAAIRAGIVPADLADGYQQKELRASFSRLVMRMVEARRGAVAAPAGVMFDDTVDPDVHKAASLGIVNGVGGNRFDPEGGLTREQLCVMLYNAARVLRPGMAMPARVPVFSDAGAVSLWAGTAVSFCSGYGVIQGVGGGNLSPKGAVTREQAILMTHRLFVLTK